MLALGSRLVQSRPANTTATIVFTSILNTEVTLITIANVTASAATARIFHTRDGTLNEDTALFWDINVAAGSTFVIQSPSINAGIQLDIGDQLAIRSSTASALNFTIYGVTERLAERIRG